MGSRSSQAGFTLLELLIVAAILSLLAATTFVVGSSSDAETTVEYAASELAAALRFARAEAMRVGEYRSATIDPDTGTISVNKVVIASGMPSIGAPLDHPIEHRPYDLKLAQLPFGDGVSITNSEDPFHFVGIASKLNTVLFDANGNAVFVWFGAARRLKDAQITLAKGGFSRKVTLSPYGRVAIK